MENKNTKQALIKKEEENMVMLMDQSGIENAIDKLVLKNNSLLPANVVVDRIKNSAGFYVSNREDLMKLDKNAKMQMLYSILKEAMVGCEAGTDFDIVPFKGKPVTIRKKEGWYKIIDMIKPADIITFTNGIVYKGDDYNWNPVTEELIINGVQHYSEKYADIEGAYCHIKFANGFKKTIFMSKVEIDTIKKVSPSGNTAFSPWTTMPAKMVKTKCVKEMAKELFTLFSAKVNSVLAQAIENDENSVTSVDNKGNIQSDQYIYSEDYSQEPIEQVEEIEAEEITVNVVEEDNTAKQVNLDEI